MKTKDMSRLAAVLLTLSILAAVAPPAAAHHLWLNATRYVFDDAEDGPRGKTTIYFGWGDFFPAHDILKEEYVERLAIRVPGGETRDLKLGDGGFLATPVDITAKGVHVFGAALKPGFVASVLEDGKPKVLRKAKDELPAGTKILMSQYSAQFAKALVMAGAIAPTDQSVATPIGHDLEIVPITNPAHLREGDHFRFRVLFKGAPLRRPEGNPEVKATYLGFSTGDDWAVATGLNAEGLGRVKLVRHGVWQIFVSHTIESPPELAGKADKAGYRASLTFEVR